jgi:hypothetical protein
MSQKTKLTLRIVAIVVALLAVGIQLQFIIIPSVNAYKFWFMVGSFILLLITNQ